MARPAALPRAVAAPCALRPPRRSLLRACRQRSSPAGSPSVIAGLLAQSHFAVFPASGRSCHPGAADAASRGAQDADARSRRGDQLRLHQRARLGRRQRADLLRRLDARSRQGDLRPEDQAAACRGQCPPDRSRRHGHLRRDHGSERRLSRRLRGFAAPRRPRADPLRRRARRALGRQLHRLPERRLHGLRGLQGRSQEAAEMAGEGGADHPRSGREDDVFRGRAPRILRRAARLYAVFLGARSDRQAQERLADADPTARARSTASRSRSPTTWRWRPTTTSPSRR